MDHDMEQNNENVEQPPQPPPPGPAPLSGVEQAKQDAKIVAKDALKGAATGGWVGAAKKAAVAAASTKSGRKTIKVVIACALVPPLAFGALIGTAMMNSLNQSEAAAGAQDKVIVNAAVADFGEDQHVLGPIRSASSQYGIPWTIVAAIYYVNMGNKAGEGATGFGIDAGKALKEGWDKTRATDIDYVASFISGRIAKLTIDGEVGKNNVRNPFAGYVRTIGEDGKATLQIGDTEEHKAIAELAKKSWIADLEKLEVKGNPETAINAFDMAEKWFKSGQEQCAAADGYIETSAGVAGKFAGVALNERQVGYAQAIIDTVAAEEMPETAALIALMTVMQESGFNMYWNSSVPGSKELAPDKQYEGGFDLGGGRKSLSVGLYQQQIFSDGTWGTVEDGMDASRSTKNFLKVLKTFNYESMDLGAAAQKVQRSAHPGYYSKHQKLAEALVDALPPSNGGYGSDHNPGAVHGDKADPPKQGSDLGSIFTGGSAKEEADKETSTETESGSSSGGKLTESKSNPHNLKVDTSLKPDIQQVQAATVKYFAEHITAMGGYRAGSVGHSKRIASDLMVADYKSETGIKAGDQMAAFFIENKKQLGIDYIIWRDKIWLGESKGWQEYSKGGFGKHLASRGWNDTTLHNDHLHVETLGAAATGGALTLEGFEVGSSSGSTSESAGCGTSGQALDTGGSGVETSGTDDYPFRLPGDVSWKQGSKDPGPDPWGMYKRECVSFVAWRMNQQMGAKKDWKRGDEAQNWPFSKAALGWSGTANAFNWAPNLTRMGYKMDMTPKKGSIAWYDAYSRHSNGMILGGMGHVAVVLEVNEKEGTVVIEQYNGGTVASNPKKASYSTFTSKIGDVSGYIHVADVE